jgi:beta-N-acetylhexosaminidase
MGKIGQSKSLEAARSAGFTIGSYLKEYGFNLDFAPDADVYSNPANKVIGTRSFGSDPDLVSLMVRWCIDGFHDAGMGTTIKHFPGHGDTKGDTHSGYVAVTKTWEELEKTELVPFADNLKTADAIMVAHITLKNALTDGLPASLSRELIQGKLRDEMGYQGLVITDALEMGAIKKNFQGNDAVLKAIEAGNDIILMPADYKSAVDAVVSAVSDGKISEERIDESVLRILRYKLRYCY